MEEIRLTSNEKRTHAEKEVAKITTLELEMGNIGYSYSGLRTSTDVPA